MSTVVFVGQEKPVKNLVDKTIFKLHPDTELQNRLLDELFKNIPAEYQDDEYLIDIDIKISLNKFGPPKPIDKNQCYQEYSNSKTEG